MINLRDLYRDRLYNFHTMMNVSHKIKRTWTLFPITKIESILRKEWGLPWYYFYAHFNADEELVVCKPFWLIPWKEWRRRIPWLEVLYQRRRAKKMFREKRIEYHKYLNERGTTIEEDEF